MTTYDDLQTRISELEAQLDEQADIFLKCAKFHEDTTRWAACVTKEQKEEETARRLRRGDTTIELAFTTGKNTTSIAKIRTKFNIPTRRPDSVQEQREIIVEMLKEGKSANSIAIELQISGSSVGRIRDSLGILPGKPGPKPKQLTPR